MSERYQLSAVPPFASSAFGFHAIHQTIPKFRMWLEVVIDLQLNFFGYINSIQNLIRIYDYHWKYIYAVAPAPLLDRHVYNFSRSIVLDSAGTFWASLILTPADFRIIIDVTCHWQWCHWLKSTGSACLNLHKRQGGSYIRLKGVEDINLRVRSPLLSTAYLAHQYSSIVKVLPA